MICDNDSIHHARKVTAYLKQQPRLELLYGARYSPDGNPAERIWAALKNYVANTAVTWPRRLRQIHSFFRNRSPDQMLATTAPWTSPWLPPGYEQNFGMLLSRTAPAATRQAAPSLPTGLPSPSRWPTQHRTPSAAARKDQNIALNDVPCGVAQTSAWRMPEHLL